MGIESGREHNNVSGDASVNLRVILILPRNDQLLPYSTLPTRPFYIYFFNLCDD